MNYRSEDAVSQKKHFAIKTRVLNILNNEIFRFLAVGVLSFAIDFGLLIVLHEVFSLELWLATPIAFLTSLFFNFILQRVFTFRAANNRKASFLKYCTLVIFNLLAADVIVLAAEELGAGYQIGKVLSTILATVWNYFLYKYWIFRPQHTKMPRQQE